MSEAIYTLPDSTTQAPAPAPAPEGVYAHSPDHVERSILKLIEIFRKPRNQEWLRTGVGQAQEIEDALWELHSAFDLDNGEGAALDLIGNILGERRDDRTDPDFRAALRARILVNQSNGRIEEMIAILQALDPDMQATIQEFYPAAIRFDVIGTFASVSAETMARLLRQAKPAGVRLEFVPIDSDETMIWSGPAEEHPANGWGAKWSGVL